MDDLLSVPCLIDDLVDTGMVNVDFNLGGLNEESEGHELKKSPSHESDSGVSIMSSPEHSVSDLNDAEYEALSPPTFDYLGNLFNDELVDYLSGGDSSNDIHDTEVESSKSVTAPKHEESGSNDNADDNRRVLRSGTKDKVNSAVSSNNDFIQQANKSSTSLIPPLKVIKVISASKNTTKSQVEQEIYEAIEEKNKKNARQAKINREKKKAYIKSLEEEVDSLKTDNANLVGRLDKLENHKSALEEEVAYLKSVLANQSTLSSLLKNIPNADVKLSSSFFQRKRSADPDHDYQVPSKCAKKSEKAGVCLHVENENVSLEFCASCSRNAQQSSS